MLIIEQRRQRALRITIAVLVAGLVYLGSQSAHARDKFSVCADPNYLPFSNQGHEGFENRIARILATDLGLPVEYTWFPQRMGFIRNTLRAQLADGSHKCDVVLGVPDGYELVITTKPYYRSTYALVYVKGRGMDDVQRSSDLLNLPEDRKRALRFGLAERNPGTIWLAKHGLLPQIAIAYASQHGDPGIEPGQLEYRDLVAGKIDATVMWGPIAGHYSRLASDTDLAVLPLTSEPGVKFDFAISAGVRFGEGGWRDEIQSLLDRNASNIQAVLQEYRVPLVNQKGSLIE